MYTTTGSGQARSGSKSRNIRSERIFRDWARFVCKPVTLGFLPQSRRPPVAYLSDSALDDKQSEALPRTVPRSADVGHVAKLAA